MAVTLRIIYIQDATSCGTCNIYRLLYDRGVPLDHIGAGVVILARRIYPEGQYDEPVPL